MHIICIQSSVYSTVFTMRPFDSVHSTITQACTSPHTERDFSGAWEQFWPDALSDATIDSYV